MALREILAAFTFDVDKTPLEEGDKLVDDFKDKLIGFGKVVVAAFAVDAIVGFAGKLIDSADELRENAIALGAIPQELQKLAFAGSTAGVGYEKLTASLAKFNKIAAESSEGKGAAKELKDLGVELKNSDGSLKSSTQLFEEVGFGIAKIKDPIERAGVASKFFGKSYANLLPLFAEGEEGIAALKQEAEDLGIVFDDAFLNNSDEINDNITKLKGGLTGIAKAALAPLLPHLVSFTKQGVEIVKGIVKWVKGTKLLQAITIGFAAKGVMALVRAGGMLVAKLGGWRALFLRLGSVILKTILPLLILEDIIVFLSGGKSALGKGLDAAFGEGTQEKVRAFLGLVVDFFKLFTTAPDRVRAKFAELRDALRADFGAIGDYFGGLAATMADMALFVVNTVTGGWENAGNKISAIADGIDLAFAILWTELKFTGLAVAAAIADGFSSMWNGIVDTAIAAITKLAGIVGKIPGFGGVAKDLAGFGQGLGAGKADTTAGAQVAALHDEAKLGLADRGDAIGRRLTAPAPAAPVVTTNNITTSADVKVSISGPVDGKAGIAKVRGATKQGVTEALDLRAAHAAGVQRGG